MSDPSNGHGEEPSTKKHRWEDDVGTSANAQAAAKALPSSTRWATSTPRQYSGDTPRAGTGGEQPTWRGLRTPSTMTGFASSEVMTPRFGQPTPSTPDFSTPAAGATPTMGMSTGGSGYAGQTPMFGGATPSASMMFGATPNYQYEGGTPVQSHFASAESQSAITAALEAKARALEKEWRVKNKRLTEEYLDSVLPSSDFFTVQPVPADYNPPPPTEPNFYELARSSLDMAGFQMDAATAASVGGAGETYDIPESLGDGMPQMKPSDAQIFAILLKFHAVTPIPDDQLPLYLLMKNLFKIKNGDNMQRRQGTRYLLDKGRVFGSHFIFQQMLFIWSHDTLDMQEQHYLMEFIKALITHLGSGVEPSAKEVILIMEPLLTTREPVTREDAKQVLIMLTRVVGFRCVFTAIKDDFAHEMNAARKHTAKVVGIIGYAAGLGPTVTALRDISFSPLPLARQTVCRALAELANELGHSIMGGLAEVVSILDRLIRDERRVRKEAATAIAQVAHATAPYGIDELAPLVEVVCEECRRTTGLTAAPFLSAFAALVAIMSPYDAQARTQAMMPTLVNQFNTPDEEHHRVMLNVVRQCISADGVSPTFILEVVLQPFFDGFWTVRRVAASKRTAAALTDATVELARKLGSTDVLQRLVPNMKDDNEQFQRMVLETVRRVLDAVGLDAAADSLVLVVLDGAISALRQDETGTNKVALACLATLCNTIGAKLRPYLKQLMDLVNQRSENTEVPMRAQAAELIARIAHTVKEASGTVYLEEQGRRIYERMLDPDPRVLTANLRATRAILGELQRSYKPSIRELLKRLTIAIKNRQSAVRQQTIALIEDIASLYDDKEVDPIQLHELATKGLFDLLDADKRETRQACARTFGVIANKIGPFAIVLELVDNFRQDKRKIRICTAVALSAVAKSCGPFTVIPYILNEFKVSEGEQVALTVQHTVLKTVRYVYEAIGSSGREYVYALVPLLERTLTETSLQMRRMAVEACTAIVLAVAGFSGFQQLTTHLLNFIHPNIVELLAKNEAKIAEERLKMITAVVSFYEAARLVLGSGVMMQYLVQGLFHPARKVRDIYRRAYNMIYIASPESMLPYYPRVEDDTEHTYTRHELEVRL